MTQSWCSIIDIDTTGNQPSSVETNKALGVARDVIPAVICLSYHQKLVLGLKTVRVENPDQMAARQHDLSDIQNFV